MRTRMHTQYQYSDFFAKYKEIPHKSVHLCYNIYWKVVFDEVDMKTLIDPKTMQQCENAYFEGSGVPAIELMENAARLMYDEMTHRFGSGKTAYFACGPGGNGGDGYACARMYAESGGKCVVFATRPPRRTDAAENAEKCRRMGIEIVDSSEIDRFERPDIWVDALYGTGLSRELDEGSAALIDRINRDCAFGSIVVSADIPSGLRGDSGVAYAHCVRADLTVAFQFPKYGHYLQDGLDMCGEIASGDIGFPEDAFPENLPRLIRPEDLRYMFAKRKRNSHKGRYGHLLIVAGSTGMAGAAALCAQAALRSGVGLVSIACPEGIVPILQVLAPCAMCIPLKQENGAIAEGNEAKIKRTLEGKTAAVIGCGLSQCVPESAIGAILESELPCVIDADAINIIARSDALRSKLRSRHILTPHLGEAARLIGHKIGGSIEDAQEIAAYGANVVLKSASRIIAGKNTVYLSCAGGCGMARGGSGDIFSGILGAIIAAHGAKADAYASVLPMLAAVACEIHGLAGEIAQAKYGAIAMNAADIIAALPEVFKRYVE